MRKMLGLLVMMNVVPAVAWAGGDDPHGYEAVYQAIRSPIPQEMVTLGRQADDQLVSEGQMDGQRVYLVTDGRSRRMNAIADRLLKAMGEDPTAWIVRVLDTEEPTVNAFVFGGKYIYVYTGFIAKAESDDEIAVVLGHEIGHSILKHGYRRALHKQSSGDDLGSLIGTLLGGNAYRQMQDAAYSRLDEEEADVFGVTIARRAGYDPLRGADFFTRMKREQDQAAGEWVDHLNQTKAELDQLIMACAQNTRLYNSSRSYQTQQNYQQLVAICNQAEAKRVEYNQFVPQYNAWAQQQHLSGFYNTHPMNQHRIAAITVLNDYLEGRRDAASLSSYKQTHTVVIALKDSGSALLKAPEKAAASKPAPAKPSSGRTLADRLRELEVARDEGLITADEYAQKRADVLNGD